MIGCVTRGQVVTDPRAAPYKQTGRHANEMPQLVTVELPETLIQGLPKYEPYEMYGRDRR